MGRDSLMHWGQEAPPQAVHIVCKHFGESFLSVPLRGLHSPQEVRTAGVTGSPSSPPSHSAAPAITTAPWF